ncbi:hypothetical protein EPYR_01140 [Erwinia pyrifoliae DSM 12163]|nr:hypothetical protein EPYR_01140 [Erwinia pyrifoliae DSM 12163]
MPALKLNLSANAAGKDYRSLLHPLGLKKVLKSTYWG